MSRLGRRLALKFMRGGLVGTIKVVLACAIVLFALAATGLSYVVAKRQSALGEVSRYNTTWAASQALAEVQKLENHVALFGLGSERVSKDDVQLRFDILFNRLEILSTGDFIPFLQAHPEQRESVEAFGRSLRELESIMDSLEQPGRVQQALDLIAPLGPELARLSATANQYGGSLVAEDQRILVRLHRLFSAMAAGLFVCGLIFIVLLFFQNRAIRQAHGSLRVLASDLREAKESAEAASETKSRFLAMMSHELRTPLNAIIGFSEVLSLEMLGSLGNPNYREYAGDILKSGKHMYAMVTDILTMARLDTGNFELNPERICSRALVDDCLSMFRGTETARDRTFSVEADRDEWPELMIDERAGHQMLLNLISNAAKFSEEDSPIRIVCRRNDMGEISLTVIDRGIGMSAEEVATALKPFQQVDSELSRKYDGAGLGLSIVKGLVEKHGGRMEIESEPGTGTSISLIFPSSAIVFEQSMAVAA